MSSSSSSSSSSLAEKLFTAKLSSNHEEESHYRKQKRIKISTKLIQACKLSTAQPVLIRPATIDQNNYFAIGILWPSSSATNQQEEDVIQISFDQIKSANISPGDQVKLIPLPNILPINHIGPGTGIRLPEATSLKLTQIDHPNDLPPLTNTEISKPLIRLWEGFIREVLVDRKYLAIHHYILIPYLNQIRLYQINDIQSNNNSNNQGSLELFVITRNTQLEIIQLPTTKTTTTTVVPTTTTDDQYNSIGGLQTQIDQIRELVELPLTRPDLYSHFHITPPRGILLYGPPGTGKTLLASIIADSLKATLLRLSTETISSAYHSEGEQKIYSIFDEAKLNSPSIILIDEIDGLFPSRESGGEVERRMVGALLSCMDGIDSKGGDRPKVIVIATTNRPNTLDPALRRPGRFDNEIEIGIPDSKSRLDILTVLLRKTPHDLSPEDLQLISDSKTHGFVGADLYSLVREASLISIKRSVTKSAETHQMKIEYQDMLGGLNKVRPSGMRELLLERVPLVKWDDIGGLKEVKTRLTECLQWPTLYPETFKRLGIKPIRGILLYGPPGCSKTLIAKALANHSERNFISVKGADLFNKFVGDSEKSVRDLFRKARAASPSIIFIDEIDSIAMARGAEADQSSSGSGGISDRILTSLLIEMDGVEELNGVLVLAATNRPEVIDQALLRPGRLDRILYVGPPDFESRIEIFKINFNKMTVHESIDLNHLSTLTDGYTGAEIVAVCQDAAINALHRDKQVQFIENQDFLKSIQNFTNRVSTQLVQSYLNWRDQVGIQSA
ncbi:hypothetical protein MJO28_010613 [Puccinia striiformis f. sp. tritici]|uniref:Uncharacterized protein n=1 Tax=Puccinia striiformis f. sp. tritici TaxID=168172 RepID=A0ACC0E859_9BASI|nr:hypothetical protein MJO28_010613 [Puccinia striiformis f. sp. tritici]